MIEFTEIPNGETWELFSRDFLVELGFYIESAPDQGADAGKDMLVTEELGGKIGRYKLKWLVSCKHNAVADRAVNENDEQNILERIESFGADGFIGLYSTVPSSGLNSRLQALRNSGKIKDYRIFDHKLIENQLIQVGYSTLIMRYFPQSYKLIRPLHRIVSEYIPLKCKKCDRDLLEALHDEQFIGGIIAFVKPLNSDFDDHSPEKIEEIYWACRGSCDDSITQDYHAQRKYTSWEDINDLAIPIYFLRFVLSSMNIIKAGSKQFSDQAYEQLKDFIMAFSQKVLRETTAKEKAEVKQLIDISFF